MRVDTVDGLTAGQPGVREHCQYAERQPYREQQHIASDAGIADACHRVDDVTGGGGGGHRDERGDDAVQRIEFAANRVGDQLLKPGVEACLGDSATERESQHDAGHPHERCVCAPAAQHQRHQQDERKSDFPQAPEQHEGASQTEAAYRGGCQGGHDAGEGDQRQQDADARFVQP